MAELQSGVPPHLLATWCTVNANHAVVTILSLSLRVVKKFLAALGANITSDVMTRLGKCFGPLNAFFEHYPEGQQLDSQRHAAGGRHQGHDRPRARVYYHSIPKVTRPRQISLPLPQAFSYGPEDVVKTKHGDVRVFACNCKLG